MIHLTRLNQSPVVVNADLIELIEVTPDTVIVLTTGQKLLVRETANEVIDRVVRFRRSILEGLPLTAVVACAASAADNAPKPGIDEGCHGQ